MFSLVVLLVTSFLETTTGVAQKTCGNAWAQQGLNCYQLFDKHMYFDDGPAHYLSGRFCNDQGAYLAEISSQQENDFIKAWLKRKIYTNDTAGVWIGAKKPYNKDDWMWVTSEEDLTFTDWDDLQDSKSGSCVSMSPSANYSWVSEDCGRTKNMKYICEKSICQLPGRCFNGSCYSLKCSTYRARSTSSDIYDKNVDDKYQACSGGHLAQIETKAESDFITSFLQDADATVDTVWTGGYEVTRDTWAWSVSGETISTFTNWATQPDSEDDGLYFGDVCIALSLADGWTWKKFECRSHRPVLCEKPETSFIG